METKEEHDQVRCDYCGKLVRAEDIVVIDTRNWNPSSGMWRCCKATCEIELLRSR
jgi:hypothetical protein